MPEPLEPSTPTRSPKKISRSNGRIRPVSSSDSHVIVRSPVRPPRSRGRTRSSRGGNGGAPASSNFRSRVCAALYRAAITSLIIAACCSERTSSFSFSCSSSQRRRSSAIRSQRAARASCQVAKPPPCTQVVAPSSVTMCVAGARQQLAVVADQQHGLAGLGEPRLQPAFSRHVEVVVRLVEQQHLFVAAQQRLQHEALLLAARQRAHLAEPGAVERHAQRGDGHRVPEDLGVVAARLAPARAARWRSAAGSARRRRPSWRVRPRPARRPRPAAAAARR